MGPMGSPEWSGINHLTPSNNPEDGRTGFNRGLGLRSRNISIVMCLYSVTALVPGTLAVYYLELKPLWPVCGSSAMKFWILQIIWRGFAKYLANVKEILWCSSHQPKNLSRNGTLNIIKSYTKKKSRLGIWSKKTWCLHLWLCTSLLQQDY